MDAAIERGKPIKAFDRDEVGDDVLFAYDETKRLLSVCTSTKVSFSSSDIGCGEVLTCYTVPSDATLRVRVR